IHLSTGYAVSLSTAQLVGAVLIAFLTWTNTRGLKYGKVVQNVFTTTKTGALIVLIAAGIFIGRNAAAVAGNFGDLWTPRGFEPIAPGVTAVTAFGIFVGLCVAQTGSLFSADAWNNITFTAGEVKNPRRDIPLSLAFGTMLVISLYLLANVAYLMTLPLAAIQQAPADRVATATVNAIAPGLGAAIMAVAILISTFGCNNGLILAGARAYYAMARDGLFFRRAGTLNEAGVPAWGLLLQCVWAIVLVIPRTFDPATGQYGNLYGNLLDYIISAALLFYILTIAAVFRLRKTMPEVPRPYRTFGYPIVPALYIVAAAVILGVLLVYRASTTWPGFIIVLLGIPVFALLRGRGRRYPPPSPRPLRSACRARKAERRFLRPRRRRLRRSPSRRGTCTPAAAISRGCDTTWRRVSSRAACPAITSFCSRRMSSRQTPSTPQGTSPLGP